jgi:hypothetical protein
MRSPVAFIHDEFGTRLEARRKAFVIQFGIRNEGSQGQRSPSHAQSA